MLATSSLIGIALKVVMLFVFALMGYIFWIYWKQLNEKEKLEVAVKAAEFFYRNAIKAGAEKKRYVVSWLISIGVHIDEVKLNMYIDAILYAMEVAKNKGV